jgi:predicted hotdog family 3-hydroxylacyl-ACP dehydratase
MTNSPLSCLIPHQGSMCLLERVVDWDEQSIRLATATHRSADNPLRANGRLRAVHLCEYGAQAMAVHGALKAQATGGRAPPGMLVSLRAVSLDCDYVEALPGELLIEARCLQAGDSSQQYAFCVTHAGSTLVSGRAAVVLRR